MSFDSLSQTLTFGVALAAVISPVLTALINNIFKALRRRSRMHRKLCQEFVYYRQRTFEKYLNDLNTVLNYSGGDNLDTYASSYASAYLFLSDEARSKAREINSHIRSCNINNDTFSLFDELADDIAILHDNLDLCLYKKQTRGYRAYKNLPSPHKNQSHHHE